MTAPIRFPDTFIPRGQPLPPVLTTAEFYHSRLEWSMFFSSVCSMQQHPGMNRENASPKSIVECAKMADEMLLEYVTRLKDGLK